MGQTEFFFMIMISDMLRSSRTLFPFFFGAAVKLFQNIILRFNKKMQNFPKNAQNFPNLI